MRTLLVIVGITVATAACGPSQPAGPLERDHKVVELDTATLTRVRVTMGAGELEMRGGSNKLLEADFTYNVAAWKPSVVHTSKGSESELTIAQASEMSATGQTENRWELVLNNGMPLDVSVQLGAGEAKLALGSLNLRNVGLRMGAGEMDMDLRGTPTTSYKVNVRGGVGSATIRLPSTVAISATASGGIGDIKMEGLEKRGDRWINPRAESSPVTIDVEAFGGVGEIRVIAE
jgi:hypothetical protein